MIQDADVAKVLRAARSPLTAEEIQARMPMVKTSDASVICVCCRLERQGKVESGPLKRHLPTYQWIRPKEPT